MKGYFKIYLASDDKPRVEFSEDWLNEPKRVKFMQKPRKYKMTFHLFSKDGQKAVSTYNVCQRLDPKDISIIIISLVNDMVKDVDGIEIDLYKSYVVIRV